MFTMTPAQEQRIADYNAVQRVIESLPCYDECEKLEVGDFAKLPHMKAGSSLVKIVRMKWWSKYSCSVTYIHMSWSRKAEKVYWTAECSRREPGSEFAWKGLGWMGRSPQMWHFEPQFGIDTYGFNEYGDILEPIESQVVS